MSTTLRPSGRNQRELTDLRQGLERGLAAAAVVEVLEPGGALLLFPDADCSLSFWEERARRRVLVRWRVTVREAPPGLGTWWVAGEASGPVGEWSQLGRTVGRMVSEEVVRYSLSLSARGRRHSG